MKYSSRFHMGILAGLLGVLPAFGEGEVSSSAFQWTNYSDLAPSPTTYSLSQYAGKVVLLVVFQYNCGGCVANAPRLGRLADTLQSGAVGSKFQAVGAEISTASYANIQTYRNSLTNSNTLTLNFPLVKVPRDTAIAASDGTGEKWKRYNSYRDVYFVINHLGVITARIEGNRGSAMSNTLYTNLRTALNNALSSAPASLSSADGSLTGFRADRIGSGYRFRRDAAAAGPMTLRILDMQGRILNSYTLSAANPEATWSGTDAAGARAPYGLYFVRVEGTGQALTRRIPLLP